MVVGIMAILAVCIKTVFMAGLTSWNKAMTKAEIYQNIRVASDQISRDLASAIAIIGVPTFKGTDPGSGPDSLSFITMSEDTIYEISYTMDGEVLKRAYDEDADCDFTTTDEEHKLASRIGDLKFQYWHSGTTAWDPGLGAVPAEDNWTDDWTAAGGARDDLPWAVRVTMKDSVEGREFRTVIYLPNSK